MAALSKGSVDDPKDEEAASPEPGLLSFREITDQPSVLDFDEKLGPTSAIGRLSSAHSLLTRSFDFHRLCYLRFPPPGSRGIYLSCLFQLLQNNPSLHLPGIYGPQAAMHTEDGSFHHSIALELLDGAAPLSRLLDPHDDLNPRPASFEQLQTAKTALAVQSQGLILLGETITAAQDALMGKKNPALEAALNVAQEARNDIHIEPYTGAVDEAIKKLSIDGSSSFLRTKAAVGFVLQDRAVKKRKSRTNARHHAAVQAVKCVQLLHSAAIVHRDLTLDHFLVHSPIVIQQMARIGAVVADHNAAAPHAAAAEASHAADAPKLTIIADKVARATFMMKQQTTEDALTMEDVLGASEEERKLTASIEDEREFILKDAQRVVLDADFRHARAVQRVDDASKDPPYHSPEADEDQYPHKFGGSRLVNSVTWFQENFNFALSFVDGLADPLRAGVAADSKLNFPSEEERKKEPAEASTLLDRWERAHCVPAIGILACLSYDMFGAFLAVVQIVGAFSLDTILAPNPAGAAAVNATAAGKAASELRALLPPAPEGAEAAGARAAGGAEAADARAAGGAAAADAHAAEGAAAADARTSAPAVSAGIRAMLTHFREFACEQFKKHEMPTVHDFFMKETFATLALEAKTFTTPGHEKFGQVSRVASPAYPAQMCEGVLDYRVYMKERPQLASLMRRCSAPRFSRSLESHVGSPPTVQELLSALSIPVQSDSEIVEKRLREIGRQSVSIVGEGDCIFHALSHQLKQLKPAQIEAIKKESSASFAFVVASLMAGATNKAEKQTTADKALQQKRVQAQRAAMCNILHKRRAALVEAWGGGDSDEQVETTIDNAIEELRKGGVYATRLGELMIHQAAIVMRVKIILMQGVSDFDVVLWDADRAPHATFYIHWVTDYHYNSSAAAQPAAGAHAGEAAAVASSQEDVLIPETPESKQSRHPSPEDESKMRAEQGKQCGRFALLRFARL